MTEREVGFEEELLQYAKRQTKATEGIYTILIIMLVLSVVGAVFMFDALNG